MAGEIAISDFLANKVLNHVFNKTAYTAATTFHVGLLKYPAQDFDTGATVGECDFPGYARVSTAASDWTVTNRTATNANPILFPAAELGASDTAAAWAIFDASTGGNLLWKGSLPLALPVVYGTTIRIKAGHLTLTTVPSEARTSLVAFALRWDPTHSPIEAMDALRSIDSDLINALWFLRYHPDMEAVTPLEPYFTGGEELWAAALDRTPSVHPILIPTHVPASSYGSAFVEADWYDPATWQDLYDRCDADVTDAIAAGYQAWYSIDAEMYGENNAFENALDLDSLRTGMAAHARQFDLGVPFGVGTENHDNGPPAMVDFLCTRRIYPVYYDVPARLDQVPEGGIIQCLTTTDGRDLGHGPTFSVARVLELAATRGNIFIWPLEDSDLTIANAIKTAIQGNPGLTPSLPANPGMEPNSTGPAIGGQ